MKKSYLVLMLATVLLSSCAEKETEWTKNPIRVTTEMVSATIADNGKTYVGLVEEDEATAVSFTSMGIVKRMLVEEGQTVEEGQLIAEIDDTQARNMLAAAEAQATQANDALERYSMLHENGSMSEVQWVEVQSKVAQANSQLEVAKKNLADCQLKSPVAGVIGRKFIKTGETAMPSQAVVSILDITNVKVKVAIPEAEINDIDSNTPSYIKVEAIKGDFTGGKIDKGIKADALTHTYDVRIKVANPNGRLLPGMVASVKFDDMNVETGKLAVPVTAVQKRVGGGLFVWTIDNDKTAHRTEITIGETIGNNVVATTGLKAGQRIVVQGYQKLSEGTKVVY